MLCFLLANLKEILSVSSKKLTEIITILTVEVFILDAAFSSLEHIPTIQVPQIFFFFPV